MTDEPTNGELNDAAREAGEINEDDAGPAAPTYSGVDVANSTSDVAVASPQLTLGENEAIAVVNDKPTKAQVKAVADAVLADLQRRFAKAKKKLTPANVAMLERITERAVSYRIEAAIPTTDPRTLKKREEKRKAVDAQLANTKAIAAVIAQRQFWATVETVVTHLTKFAVGAIVAAV